MPVLRQWILTRGVHSHPHRCLGVFIFMSNIYDVSDSQTNHAAVGVFAKCFSSITNVMVLLVWVVTIFARDIIQYMLSAHMLSQFRPSVRLSHGWISQKRLKLRSRSFHRTVALALSFFRAKFHQEILTSSPWTGASNKGGVGQIRNFQLITRRISETVQDRTKFTIND